MKFKNLLLIILTAIVYTQCHSTPNRNFIWKDNSCWIHAGIQALTSCTEFAQYLTSAAFEPESPASELQKIIIALQDSSSDNPVSSDIFYKKFTGLGFGSYGTGGGDFVPQLLYYLRVYVDPETIYKLFSITSSTSKKYLVDGGTIEGNIPNPLFTLAIENFNPFSVLSPNVYSLIQIQDDSKPLPNTFIAKSKALKDLTKTIIFGQRFNFALIAKGLSGHSKTSRPSGPHTITLGKKGNQWYEYDDLNKQVKQINPHEEVLIKNQKYEQIIDEAKQAVFTGTNNYTTDFLYVQANPIITKVLTSIIDLIKNNRFHTEKNKLDLNTLENEDKFPRAESWRALHWACIKADFKIIEALLANNADIHAQTAIGDTPLHFAAITCSDKTIEHMISHGANVNALNKLGYSPLYYALKHENILTAKALLQKGANINLLTKTIFYYVTDDYGNQKKDKDGKDEVSELEVGKHIFNYMLKKINIQNSGAFTSIIEEFCNKKPIGFDATEVRLFITSLPNKKFSADVENKIKNNLEALLSGEDAGEKARLAEEVRLEKEKKEAELKRVNAEEKARIAEVARLKEAARLKAEVEEKARLAEIARLAEVARIQEKARLKAEKKEKARLAEEERLRLANPLIAEQTLTKKLNDLKDSLERLREKLTTLKTSLDALRKKLVT